MANTADVIELAGCRPEPLADYLKALGILRLVAEQKDPTAAGFWRGDRFFLRTRMKPEELVAFFMHDYAPTPLLSPWNGGSGFFPNDNKDGIDLIRSTEQPRFSAYRSAITTVDKVLSRLGMSEKPDGDAKVQLLKRLRSELDDRALEWLDAALVLGEDRVRYAPLLGTGGNDGRLEFSNNFMKRLAELLLEPKRKPKAVEELLRGALFADVTRHLQKAPIGQYDPGSAGGVNASVGFDGNALVNSWSFILMLEGSLLLTAGAVRRYRGSSSSGAAFPFTVSHSSGGNEKLALSEENRDEIWLPLWETPTTLPELRVTFSEGRAQNGVRQARNPVEFSLALASFGTTKGLSGFTRYAFLQRNGKSYFATSLGFHPVRHRDQAGLLRELEGWFSLGRPILREHSNASARLIHRYDGAVLRFLKSGDQKVFTAIIERLGEMARLMAQTPKLREKLGPLPVLDPRWREEAYDFTAEYRLAASLASLGAVRTPRYPAIGRTHVRGFLEPYDTTTGKWGNARKRPIWVGVDLPERMLNLLHHRVLHHDKTLDKAVPQQRKMHPVDGQIPAPSADIELFIEAQVDDARLEALFFGLALVGPGDSFSWARETNASFLPLAYVLSKLAFAPGLTGQGQSDDRLPPFEIPRRLAGGATKSALQRARQFLFARDQVVPSSFVTDSTDLPLWFRRRLAAALLFPLSKEVLYQWVLKYLKTDDKKEEKETANHG